MLKEKPYGLSKDFINSLSKIKGKEDYSQIDARLKKMSIETLKDLFKI